MNVNEDRELAELINKLSEAKGNYRQMFENVLHIHQRVLKKAGVRFKFRGQEYFEVIESSEHHDTFRRAIAVDVFTIDKGPYGKNPETGKKRRGWTIFWHREELDDHWWTEDGPRAACDWPLKIIPRFLEVYDKFRKELKKATIEDMEKYDGEAELLGARFGLLPPPEEEPLPVACAYCDWTGTSNDPTWQEGLCPKCGVELRKSTQTE